MPFFIDFSYVNHAHHEDAKFEKLFFSFLRGLLASLKMLGLQELGLRASLSG